MTATFVSQRLLRLLLLLVQNVAETATGSQMLAGVELIFESWAMEGLTHSESLELHTKLWTRLAVMVAPGPGRRAATATAARGMHLGGVSSTTLAPPRLAAPMRACRASATRGPSPAASRSR